MVWGIKLIETAVIIYMTAICSSIKKKYTKKFTNISLSKVLAQAP